MISVAWLISDYFFYLTDTQVPTDLSMYILKVLGAINLEHQTQSNNYYQNITSLILLHQNCFAFFHML